MELKVKFNELNTVKKTFDQDKEELDKEIKNILAQVQKLRGIWQGVDATDFCNNLEAYAENMKNISTTFDNFSKFVDSANKGYKEGDEAFSSALRRENAKYE